MSLSLATKGIISPGDLGMGSQGVLHSYLEDGSEEVVVAPVVLAPLGGGGGSGGGWAGERVGWSQDAELLSPEESKRVREELENPEQVIFTFTRIEVEEETYVFDGPAIGTSDPEFGPSYIGNKALEGDVEEVGPTPPPVEREPADWWGLITATVLSFAAGRLAARVHPTLSIAVGVGGAWLVRDRPWALGGVLIGAPLALVKAESNSKVIAVRKKPKVPPKPKAKPKPRRRIKLKVQRIRVYGKRKR